MKIKKITALMSAVTVAASMLVPVTVSHAEAKTITVGTNGDYQTIREAVAKAKELNPQSEADRVTINVNPGDYEEQVVFENIKYITLQKTPGTEGDVDLHWYYCTGYAAANCDLSGSYNENIDWYANPPKDASNKTYAIGESIQAGTVLTYTTKSGETKTETVRNAACLGNTGGMDKMATLILRNGAENITIKDLNVVNSVPVFATQGEKDAHLTPLDTFPNLPDRSALANCTEDTPEEPISSVGEVTKAKYEQYIASNTLTAGQSVWLARSGAFNERGHAIAYTGSADKITFENVRLRGNQDSLYAAGNRAYFKNCDIIGGTDYIYGGGTAVFDNCKLGLEGMSDKSYGSPIAVGGHDVKRKYGYLFYNCTLYNMRDNNGTNNYGGPWQAGSQVTYYNCILDDNASVGNSAFKLDSMGWRRFGAENGLSRSYEYGTKNASGSAVDFSQRIVNKPVSEGGPGIGTVLDQWQILEFNPRNYFSKNCDAKYTDDWDPMNFASTYLTAVDSEIAAAAITVPSGEETEVSLPAPTDSNIEFHWESASTNAVVSDDETKMTVVRPALGEEPIVTSVILYVRDKTTGFGDKKEILVTINATTDSTNVFNIPVTITQSLAAENEYTVTISKEGALIKEQVIPVSAAETTATIENIPASASGISYDIKVVSKSNDFTLTAPADGKTTIDGVTGTDVPLNIKATKVIDEKVNLDIDYSSSDGNKAYDLIALAKEKGASNDIGKSDIITVNYTLTTKQDKTSGNSFIDLLSAAPAQSLNQSGNASRFVLAKLGHWNQLDFVDSTQGYSGSKNNEHQYLNMCGKFQNGVPSKVTVTIDYKSQTIAVSGEGTGADSCTFATFPQTYEKGKLNMGIYAGGEVFDINNISVTYKREVTDDNPESTAEPTGKPSETAKPTSMPPSETTVPDKKASIKDVKIENGNTVVTLENITSGTVIAVKYNGRAVSMVKTKEVTENPITIEGIEADKVMVWNSLKSMQPLCGAYTVNTLSPTAPASTEKPIIKDAVTVDFTKMSAVPEYTAANGQGFVAKSSAIMPSGHERQVAPVSEISISSEGAQITEKDGAYLHKKNNSNDGDDYNNGGLIYRIDTGKPGAYHLEVEITGTKDDTIVAPTGMNGGNLTGTNNWDNCKQVPRTVSAVWNEHVWSYDFATGEDFIEIEIEPKSLASASDAKTVGVKNIKITPLDNNTADGKPTIHILGDSTQKSYSFDETISAWGQTLKNYFDLDKVNVVNYSMGGRAMKSNYCEGRFDEILIRGKEGDFVFIHSAHNDETVSTNRFSRGAGTKKDDFAVNDANYNRWLDMYVEAIKARGMTPVLVTAMPRVNGSTGVPNSGFNPNSPANMRAKAQSDPQVALAELYDGAKAYIAKIDGKEAAYIYNNIEAGETPAANAANGAKGDGTHYKEAAAKQWSRIILQSIYDQSVASTDTYTDKDIMTKVVSLMPEKVKTAAQTGDWSAVFPEMASDVSAVDIVPNAEKQAESNYYYRNNIEKALQLGLLHKDTQNLFKPTETITVGEYARGIEKAFGIAENSLTNYTKTYAELSAEASAVSLQSDNGTVSEEIAENDDMELSADGELTITVQQPAGGTVTVYNNSAFKTATADVSANVEASAVISNNDYFTFTAPSEVVKRSDKNASFNNKDISTNAIEVRNNGTKQPSYTAKADGLLTLYLYFDNTKIVTCENKTDSTKSEKYIEGAKADEAKRASVFGEVVFNVEKGKTYEIYTNGGTGRLFGVKYESTDYPQSTTSLSVNSGDEIRVVAVPAENHVNGSILVNGEAKSTAKEYTFTVEGNTTVSATFVSEPALVEVTKIASDAALTREAMGAILYDAYQEFQNSGDADSKENMAKYMSNNGGIPSPSDPNYDPNIQYEGSPYIPTVGWGALTDVNELTDSLYQKVKNAYNLGLMRSEKGIGRGQIALGTELEPKAEVTRAKAAKSLVFAFILTQTQTDENQIVPDGFTTAAPSEIVLPNPNAQTTVFN